MTIYCDNASLTSGTTVDTFGTGVNIILNASAKKIIGVITVSYDSVFTAAEGSATRLRLNSSGVPKLAAIDQLIGCLETSGPATNSSGQSCTQQTTPLDFDTVGGETITIDAAPTTTITTGRRIQVGLLYRNSDSSKDVEDQIGNDNIADAKGFTSVDASQLTTTATALTAITIPGWAREIIGCKAVVHKSGAITTGESVGGFFGLTSTIPDIGVQNYPTNGLGATLGTPVGTGMYDNKIPWLPMSIKTPGKDATVTPTINLRSAVTTANRVAFCLAWR